MARIVTFKITIEPDAATGEPTAKITHASGAAQARGAALTADLTADIANALGRVTERHVGKPHTARTHTHTDANGKITVHENH